MNELEAGINLIKSKLQDGKELCERDFIIALTASLIEEAAQDMASNGMKDESTEK
ncbi:MAG: hypothetical protein Fur0010_13130 [Bdellovibrio sp.]